MSVTSTDNLAEEFDALDVTDGEWLEADYNVAPTKPVRIVVNRPLRRADGSVQDRPTRQLRVVSWGLVPSWAKDRKTQGRMFNARSETVATTGAFKAGYAKRRCLVPADGWYEWRPTDGPIRQPTYLTPQDGHVLALAGLYEFWRDPADPTAPTLTTCSILTTAATGVLADVHDRMPLVLSPAGWGRWLDPSVGGPDELLAAVDEAAREDLELRPVGTGVNKVDNNGPELTVRVEPRPEQTLF